MKYRLWVPYVIQQIPTIYFTYSNVYVSMRLSQIIPLSPSLTVSKSLSFMSALHESFYCPLTARAHGRHHQTPPTHPMMFIEASELEPFTLRVIHSMLQESPSTLLRKYNSSLFKIILGFRGNHESVKKKTVPKMPIL